MSDYLRDVRKKVGHDLLVLPSAAAVIRDERGRVLFGLHADRKTWVLPGGLVEPAELPADAAVRETWEETGLLIEITGLLGVYGGPALVIHYDNGDVASYIATIFRGRVLGGELRADGSETLDVRYMSRQELESVTHSAWMDLALDRIFAVSSEPGFQTRA